MRADTTRRPLVPACASALRMKCTRGRHPVAQITRVMAAFSPWCASEINSFTPRKPRRASLRRNPVPNGSASDGPVSMPSTSRRPSLLTPTAIMTANEMILPFWRNFT